MVVYHGATVDLRIANILAEGKIIQEYFGALDGDTAECPFYTKNFPITDNAGVATDAEVNVDVYTRVPGGVTWVELADDGSTFDIVGATGSVIVEEASNQAGDALKEVSISYWTDALVGRGQDASIEYERDLEVVHELGNAAPQELASGHTQVSGSIGSLYVSRDTIGKVLGESDFYKRLASFSFYLYPNKNVGGQPYLKVAGAQFYGGSIKATLKGIMAVNVKYKGLVASVGTA